MEDGGGSEKAGRAALGKRPAAWLEGRRLEDGGGSAKAGRATLEWAPPKVGGEAPTKVAARAALECPLKVGGEAPTKVAARKVGRRRRLSEGWKGGPGRLEHVEWPFKGWRRSPHKGNTGGPPARLEWLEGRRLEHGGGPVKAGRAALERLCGEVACPHKGWTGGTPTPEWLEGRKLKTKSTKQQIHFKNMRLLFRNFSLVGFLAWVSPLVVETLVYFLSSVFCPPKSVLGSREKSLSC